MSQWRHRVWPGALVALCFLTVLCGARLLPGGVNGVLAQSGAVPDLTVASVSWSPEFPAIGGTVAFTVAVRNQGDSLASVYHLTCYIDDHQVNSTWHTAIYPGTTVLKTFTWKAQAGPHIIRAVVDEENSITESDEGNNESTYAFSVLAPDLVVAAVSRSPENPSIGDKVTFSVTVKNQGDKYATASQASLLIDGQPRWYREVPYLEVGANSTVTFTWLAVSGNHTVVGEADRLNQVKESDESNNEMELTCATAVPDLAIDSITWSPLNRAESSNVTMTVKITNLGSGNAANSWLAFYINDWLQTSVSIGPLQAGASVTRTYSWIAGAGTPRFKAFIDSRSEIGETDETNNILSVTLPAVLPDLIVQTITCYPAHPLTSHRVVFTVVVKNQGLSWAGDCDLDLHINEFSIVHQRVPTLDAGATAALSFSWVTQSDLLTLRAVVDVGGIINETNESNNEKSVDIGFSERSPDTDLSITSLSWSPTGPAAGDTVTISISILNKGPGQAGPSQVNYYIDDVFLGPVYADKIGAGETIINSIVWQAQPGIHTIKAAVDCNNVIAETDEENNIKEIELPVAAPDLAIGGLSWSPLEPQAGEEVKFNVTIENRGNHAAVGSYVNYYVDGAPRGSHFIEEMEPGAAVTRSFTWRTQTDSPVFRIVVDEAGDVSESDESNNVKIVSLPAPDLAIEGIVRSPESLSENATVTFVVNIKNQGAGPAQAPHISGYIDGIFLASIQFNDLVPGDTAAGACIWKASSGEHTFKAVAAMDSTFAERDEGNNAAEITFVVESPSTEIPTEETGPVSEGEEVAPGVTARNVDIIEMMLGDNETAGQEAAPDVSSAAADETPWWQKILTNKLVIIGVGVVGAGALTALLLLRRRSQRGKAAE